MHCSWKTTTTLLGVFIVVNMSFYIILECINHRLAIGKISHSSYMKWLSLSGTLRTADQANSNFQRKAQVFEDLQTADERLRLLKIEDTEDIIIRYRNFTTPLPLFDTEEDKKLFLKSPINQNNLKPPFPGMLQGEINVVRNGSFRMFFDCGYRSNVSYIQQRRKPSVTYDYLVPLIIPMAFLFQHFMDGTLPKIVQAYEFIRRPGVKILLEKPFHDNIYQILNILNISDDKIVWHGRFDWETVYKAEYMIFTCITPPLHPDLWQGIRQKLGVREDREGPWHEGKVMLLTRAGSTGGSRRIINEAKLVAFLQNRYGHDDVVTFTGTYSFFEARELFSKVRLIVGPHGGAFYNMMFAPTDTVIVEFGPVTAGGGDIHSLPHAIFWRIASLLQQPYWRIPVIEANTQNDMKVNYETLTSILDKIDGNSKVKPVNNVQYSMTPSTLI